MKKIAIIIFYIGLLFAIDAQTNKQTGYSINTLRPASILNQSPGVRSLGMAGAQVGRADDLSASFYNPAGLGSVNYWEWGLAYTEMQKDVNANHFLMSFPLPYGTIGLQSGFFTVRDNDYVKNNTAVHPDRNRYAYIVNVGYGVPVYKKDIFVGLNVKWASVDFARMPAGFANQEKGIYFDFGVLHKYDFSKLKGLFYYFPKFSYGFNLKNMHPKFEVNNESNQDAFSADAGLSLYYSYRFMFNIDVINRKNIPSVFKVGGEFWAARFLALRYGMAFAGTTSRYRSLYWGLGLGESIASSKLSVEYSGERRENNGPWGSTEYYHNIAIHQSFENIAEVKDPYGRMRKLRLAQTDRYNSPLQFMLEQNPEEIVDIAMLKRGLEDIDDDEGADEPDNEPIGDDTITDGGDTNPTPTPTPAPVPKPKPRPIRKRAVAVFPFVKDFAGAKTKATDSPKILRSELIAMLKSEKKLKAMRGMRYKLTPKREARESQMKYLNRVCNFHRVSLLIFGTVIMDESSDKIIVKLVFYKKGDKEFGGFVEKSGPLNSVEQFKKELGREFILESLGLLGLEKDV